MAKLMNPTNLDPINLAPDLSLPDWGPYSRQYMGVSHITDPQRGVRFDLSVFPGLYRRKIEVPHVMWESGYHPWEAAPDLSYYAHRHELVWKDEVYCDIACHGEEEDAREVVVSYFNHASSPQSLILHAAASLHFPPAARDATEPLDWVEPNLPAEAVFLHALDYTGLTYTTPRPTDHLRSGGLMRGEARGGGWCRGSALGDGFGAESGDEVSYAVSLPQPLREGGLLLRYQTAGTLPCRVQLVIDGVRQTVDLPPAPQPTVHRFTTGFMAAGEHRWTLSVEECGPLMIDAWVWGDEAELANVSFRRIPWNPEPVVQPGPAACSLMLHYEQSPWVYGLAWRGEAPSEVRPIYHDELDVFLRRRVHLHSAVPGHSLALEGNRCGHYQLMSLAPLVVAPGASGRAFWLVCRGSASEVRARLAAWSREAPVRAERRLEAARQKAVRWADCNPAGEPHRFGQQLMAATTASNVVFPIYSRRRWIRHNTPGRWWDCLYTWDSGFCGLGLLELSLDRARECLEAYLTPLDDPQAFVHFGSLVPVQLYLAYEIWNRSQDEVWLAKVYPRLKRYQDFLAGHWGGSTTPVPGLDLIKTWDYFYNSGGWDDYPPQKHVFLEKLSAHVAPVINTAQAIRGAKLLAQMAEALGLEEDVRHFECDVERFGQALQTHAWDASTGYFGYVCHDGQGQAKGLLCDPVSGENFNQGLDGAYPLVAGICTPDQEKRLLNHLFDPRGLWTPIGLGTVDQRAPYARTDGYWNGAVWMPHQWFFWKTMLTMGLAERAWQIASTGLELWTKETQESYQCFEHFMIESGRGAGWHHFGGLSTPVLCWFAAYYQPGRLTTGFDARVATSEFSPDKTTVQAMLHLSGKPGTRQTILVCLKAGPDYAVSGADSDVQVYERIPGLLEITLPADAGIFSLTIAPVRETQLAGAAV